jgi:hypothetical protein
MTISAILASAGDTGDRVVLQLGCLAFMSAVVWNGVKTWRGQEPRRVDEHERTVGPWRTIWGTTRRYRTKVGSAYLTMPVGAGFGLAAATDLVRLALGEDESWGPWWTVSYFAAGLSVVSFVGLTAYLWTGLPDCLRPPCQRGWEVVDGELVLVRPGRTAKERAERRPITVDPAYRAAAEGRQPPPFEP